MSNFTKFGNIISSSLSYGPVKSATSDLENNYSLYWGQITKVYSIDDPKNDERGPGVYTLYDVQINKPRMVTETIDRCRMLQPGFGGGINNFLEITPTTPSDSSSNKSNQLKRGHWVLVGFISGKKNSGVILGGLPHLNPAAVKSRPKKSQGVHTEGEIQGLNFQVTNDGELIISFNGPKNDKGELIDLSLGPTVVKIDKSGSVNVSTNQNQSISVDRTDKTIKVINGETSYEMKQDGSKVTVKCKDLVFETTKDVIVKADGNANVTAKKDAIVKAKNISLNGDNGKILTTTTSPYVDFITGIPTIGVPNVKAG